MRFFFTAIDKIGFLILLLLILGVPRLSAQHQPKAGHSDHSHVPVFQAIQQDFRQDRIDLGQKLLYQAYAAFRPEDLPQSYRSADRQQPVKCGLPLIRELLAHREELSAATITKIQSILERPIQAQYTHLSPSGKFQIQYSTSGNNAVPAGDSNPQNGVPDYVDQVAAAADSSWRHQVGRLGFANPISGSSHPYPIFIENINLYGFTNTGGPTDTYIVIHNNFQGFPENTDPEGDVAGAIKATVAHEFKHAIQYANSWWYNSDPESPHSTEWSEMDATLMEEVVYDNVNDYYNYITNENSSVFLTSSHLVPASYYGVTWFIYFWERYGPEFWPAVWQRIEERYERQQLIGGTDYLTMVEAITLTIEEDYGKTLLYAFTESHLWHYASGPVNSIDTFGFSESSAYPDPFINRMLQSLSSSENDKTLGPLSADYITITTNEELDGYLQLITSFSDNNTHIGVITYLYDGTIETRIERANSIEGYKYTSSLDWSDIKKVGLAAVNSHQDVSTEYNFQVSAFASNGLQINPNYPNPFNPTTTIEFGLVSQTHVLLEVFDITGKKIRTLNDGALSAGVHQITFNGSDLASGVYFYRLLTDQQVRVKKMTLIK